ncbi:hypothetical protein ASPVEDRAFT_126202, partial [Aspergillus versicolor CBS 583.65]
SSSRQSGITAMGITSDRRGGPSETRDEFFGESSIASFLDEIKQSAITDPAPEKDSAVDTSFNVSSSSLPGIEESKSAKPQKFPSPPRQLADYLLKCYFDKIHSLYPFIHKPSFLRAYNALWTPEGRTYTDGSYPRMGLGDPDVLPSTFHCALNILLAQGCHFSELHPSARDATADEFARRSEQLLKITSLDKENLALVQTLLVTSHYLQGGDSSSRCWNIIGLACRIAHSSSMMLGRPPMTNASVVPLPEAINDENLDSLRQSSQTSLNTVSHTENYVRTLQLYKILRRTLYEMYDLWEDKLEQPGQRKTKNSQAQIAMDLEADLEGFKSQLPVQLAWDHRQGPAPLAERLSRESNLLRARFLHLRILILRPTLVSFCHENHHAQYPTSAPNTQPGRPTEPESKILSELRLSCSTSCVEAAIQLVQLMNDISSTEMASVWWYSVFYTFTAGIVLVLARTSPIIEAKFSNQILDDSWRTCCHCLESMSRFSKSAEICAFSLQKILSAVSVRDTTPSGPRHIPEPPSQNLVETVPQATIGNSYMANWPRFTSMPLGDPMPSVENHGTGTEQDFINVPDHDTTGYLCNGQGSQDFSGSLWGMMWDDSWLTAPFLF